VGTGIVELVAGIGVVALFLAWHAWRHA